MRTIYKYELKTTDVQALQLPKGYEILTVVTQYEAPMLYAIVDTTAELERVNIMTYGTGHEMLDYPAREQYVGTYQIAGGTLVFHVFKEVGE